MVAQLLYEARHLFLITGECRRGRIDSAGQTAQVTLHSQILSHVSGVDTRLTGFCHNVIDIGSLWASAACPLRGLWCL